MPPLDIEDPEAAIVLPVALILYGSQIERTGVRLRVSCGGRLQGVKKGLIVYGVGNEGCGRRDR